MSSLRTRLLAGVLVLAAAGLVALAAVTYAEQSSFLRERVDREVVEAGRPVSMELDRRGYLPQPRRTAGVGGAGRDDLGGPGGFGHGGPLFLPPGTYGQRREADGTVLGEVLIAFGEKTSPAKPLLPERVPVGRLFTVGSIGDSGLRYRVYVQHDPEDRGLTVAAVPLRDVDQTLSRLLLVEGLVIAGVLLALGLTAFFVVRLGLRPLDRIEVTAGQIAAGDLSRRVSPATTRTEVGRLGLALNGMLARLERAFADREASEERLRQFLADASHELRTPLASIRGYAELYRMGAMRERGEIETAMRRIEDEAARMGVLVEDLLALARLDEEPEPRREPVDMAQLARDAVADARATAAERTIDVKAPAQAPVTGDPNQLHQVIANLMRNALVHTPAGTAIDVSVNGSEKDVTLVVRDHGPGLPEGVGEHLFERFWRAQRGRERGRAGAGLGLAIAREVVEAHGGRIDARNAPDGGAVFTVGLPTRPGPEAGTASVEL